MPEPIPLDQITDVNALKVLWFDQQVVAEQAQAVQRACLARINELGGAPPEPPPEQPVHNGRVTKPATKRARPARAKGAR